MLYDPTRPNNGHPRKPLPAEIAAPDEPFFVGGSGNPDSEPEHDPTPTAKKLANWNSVDGGRRAEENQPGTRPLVNRMSDVQPTEVDWLWPNRIARGKFTLIAGDPGLGKSFLTIDLAARVSTGSPWPDQSGLAPRGNVLMMNCEDDLGDTVRPRLDAACADVERVFALQGVAVSTEENKYERQFDLARDLPVLELAVEEAGEVVLVTIDPISAFLGKTDSHKNAEVRSLLAPLSEFAARRHIAVVGVSHLRKGEGAAIYRAMGSLAFVAAARAAFAITRDRSDESRRLLLPIKNNLGDDRTGMAFTLTTQHGAGTTPHLAWEPDPIDVSADEALAPPSKKGPEPKGQDEAETFLREALANGARPSKDIEAEAKEAHGISAKTLMRARNNIGVVAYRPVVPGAWWLELPKSKMAKQDGQPSIPCLLGSLGHVEIPSDQELAQQRQVGQVGQEDQVVQEAQEAQV